MKTLVTLGVLATLAIVLPTKVEVRIEGYLGGALEQVKPWKMLDVRIGEGELRPFALTNLITLTSTGPTAAQIVAQLQPIKPNLVFQGGEAQLEEIRTAAPDQRLEITGYTQFGSQWVLVKRVERSAPITGPTPRPTLREELFGF